MSKHVVSVEHPDDNRGLVEEVVDFFLGGDTKATVIDTDTGETSTGRGYSPKQAVDDAVRKSR